MLIDPRSSQANTMEACDRYNVKAPHLNADLYENLLSKTDINKELQKSLVRGWREGFDLGSELPEEDHIVGSPVVQSEHREVLKASLENLFTAPLWTVRPTHTR